MAIYIHALSAWPDFFWDESGVSSLLANARHEQGRLLGRMESLGFGLQGEADLVMLTEDVLKSSAIEGEKLDAEQVRSSLARRLGMDAGGLPVPSRAVDGVVEMMLDATRKYDQPLTKPRLCSWHAALFPTGYSGLRRIAMGTWRKKDAGPMQVVSGRLGHERVHFETPDAARIPVEMKRFLAWFNAPPSMDPLLKATLAHFWFVTVHPFEDGNGRIARAIADMSLARSDGHPQRFYSMSSQIESERKAYYDVLEQCQKGDLDITSWITWFLECFLRALSRAEEALAGVLRKAVFWQDLGNHEINDRQRRIIDLLLGDFKGHLTSGKYAKLTRCSTDTALRDLKDLVEKRILIQGEAGGRSTHYRLRSTER
jgi:Fic family protein